jgi:deazaflavin-dependent oxidoreductase (nitroreductase family)
VSADTESWLQQHADTENCYLTTRGRRTGRPHEIEIWFGALGDVLYLISGGGPGADWYRNLVADPAVSVRIDGETRWGRAYPVTERCERQAVGQVMGPKYRGWGGDPEIDLSEDHWTFGAPAVGVTGWTTDAPEPT